MLGLKENKEEEGEEEEEEEEKQERQSTTGIKTVKIAHGSRSVRNGMRRLIVRQHDIARLSSDKVRGRQRQSGKAVE